MRFDPRAATIILIGAVFAGTIWLILLAPDEPVYKGKPLNDWLDAYVTSGSVIGIRSNDESDEAVRHIGTNAIPILLRMLETRDSATKSALVEFTENVGRDSIRFPSSWRSACFPNGEAAEAFGALGALASNAVPRIIQIYHLNISSYSKQSCLNALGWIGPSASVAIPCVITALTNSDSRLRATATNALANLRGTSDLPDGGRSKLH